MKHLGPTWFAANALIEAIAAHAKYCTDGPACTRAPYLLKRLDDYTRLHFNEGRRKRIMRHGIERLIEEHPASVPDDVIAALRQRLYRQN